MQLKQSLKNNQLEYGILILALLSSVISTVVTMHMHGALADGDAIAHLNTARRVIDSLNPGFTQLGYVWLPANHLLMLPFIWNNFLYYSGLAGIIISMAAYVIAALFVYKIAWLLTESKLAGILACGIFAVNPNMLYMQSTPLTEMLYVCTLSGAIYYLLLWAKERKLSSLVASSLFLCASNLSRYDGWFISGVIIIALFINEIKVTKNWLKTEATIIVFGLITFLSPFLWMIWNYIIFGNPIYFAIGQYSAKAQQLSLQQAGQLLAYYNLKVSLLTVFYSTQMTTGWVVLILGTVGSIYLFVEMLRSKKYYQIFYFILSLQILYYVLNIYFGNGAIFVPEIYPYKLFNVRYALTFIPLFSISAGVFAARLKWFWIALAAAVVIEYSLMAMHHSVVTYNEATMGFAGESANATRIQAGQWLASNYNGGLILADTFIYDQTAFYSKAPLRDWVINGDGGIFNEALGNPEKEVKWILEKQGDAINAAIGPKQLVEDNFGLVYENQDIAIYEHGAKNITPTIVPVAQFQTQTQTQTQPMAQQQPAVQTPSQSQEAANPNQYIVKPNDYLSLIAQEYYNDGDLWPIIAKANNITWPYIIFTGDVLTIPKNPN